MVAVRQLRRIDRQPFARAALHQPHSIDEERETVDGVFAGHGFLCLVPAARARWRQRCPRLQFDPAGERNTRLDDRPTRRRHDLDPREDRPGTAERISNHQQLIR